MNQGGEAGRMRIQGSSGERVDKCERRERRIKVNGEEKEDQNVEAGEMKNGRERMDKDGRRRGRLRIRRKEGRVRLGGRKGGSGGWGGQNPQLRQ